MRPRNIWCFVHEPNTGGGEAAGRRSPGIATGVEHDDVQRQPEGKRHKIGCDPRHRPETTTTGVANERCASPPKGTQYIRRRSTEKERKRGKREDENDGRTSDGATAGGLLCPRALQQSERRRVREDRFDQLALPDAAGSREFRAQSKGLRREIRKPRG